MATEPLSSASLAIVDRAARDAVACGRAQMQIAPTLVQAMLAEITARRQAASTEAADVDAAMAAAEGISPALENLHVVGRYAIALRNRKHDKWAIVDTLRPGYNLTRAFEWEEERVSAARTDGFLDRARFSLEESLAHLTAYRARCGELPAEVTA